MLPSWERLSWTTSLSAGSTRSARPDEAVWHSKFRLAIIFVWVHQMVERIVGRIADSFALVKVRKED